MGDEMAQQTTTIKEKITASLPGEAMVILGIVEAGFSSAVGLATAEQIQAFVWLIAIAIAGVTFVMKFFATGVTTVLSSPKTQRRWALVHSILVAIAGLLYTLSIYASYLTQNPFASLLFTVGAFVANIVAIVFAQ